VAARGAALRSAHPWPAAVGAVVLRLGLLRSLRPLRARLGGRMAISGLPPCAEPLLLRAMTFRRAAEMLLAAQPQKAESNAGPELMSSARASYLRAAHAACCARADQQRCQVGGGRHAACQRLQRQQAGQACGQRRGQDGQDRNSRLKRPTGALGMWQAWAASSGAREAAGPIRRCARCGRFARGRASRTRTVSREPVQLRRQGAARGGGGARCGGEGGGAEAQVECGMTATSANRPWRVRCSGLPQGRGTLTLLAGLYMGFTWA
jgi:hypothetical protein